MSTSVPQEQVFRLFTSAEGKFYASQRLAYPPELYKLIFEHHAATGGTFGSLLDVGCGPGNSTRDLAAAFDTALGVDASLGMIASAQELGGKTGSEKDIKYIVSSAENFSSVAGLGPASIDLLTAAAAAHWFDMNEFWKEAEKVLKPGGTVAIWTRSPTTCHPSTPNAGKINAILRRFTQEILKPYEQPGNALSRNMYDDLVMPWSASNPVQNLPKSQFVKHDIDRDGVPSEGKEYFGGGYKLTARQVEGILTTASPVVRWREAHPELAGTDNDLVNVLIKELRSVIGNQESLTVGGGTAILLFKKVVQESA